MKRRWLTFSGLLTVVACVLGWFFLAPAAIGGRATYVVTHGISMQPRFHTGDLAVLYPRPSYHVGEIVAYRSVTLHTVVMHRIVAQSGDHFTFKGDNNSWLDPDHPTQADMLGALAFQLPGGGRYLHDLHSPAGMATVGTILALVFALGGVAGVGSRARRRRRVQRYAGRRRAGAHRAGARQLSLVEPALEAPALRAGVAHPKRRPLAAGAGLRLLAATGVVVACVAGEVWFAHQSATRATTSTVSVAQTGLFGYHATVNPSVVYPSGRIATGDPIFTKVVDTVTATFAYASAGNVSGTVALDVEVSNANGWHDRLASGRPVALVDGRATASVPVDIEALTARLAQVAAATGQLASGGTVTLTPVLDVRGTAHGRPLTGVLDATMSLVLGSGSLAPAGDAKADVTGQLQAKVPGVAPRTWTLLGHRASRRDVEAGLALFGIAALVMAAMVYFGARSGDRAEDDVTAAEHRYGERIVDAESISFDGPIVELTSMAALNAIAERYDRVILHTERGPRHSYVVRDEVSWYRYEIRPAGAQHARGRAPDRPPAARTASGAAIDIFARAG